MTENPGKKPKMEHGVPKNLWTPRLLPEADAGQLPTVPSGPNPEPSERQRRTKRHRRTGSRASDECQSG